LKNGLAEVCAISLPKTSPYETALTASFFSSNFKPRTAERKAVALLTITAIFVFSPVSYLVNFAEIAVQQPELWAVNSLLVKFSLAFREVSRNPFLSSVESEVGKICKVFAVTSIGRRLLTIDSVSAGSLCLGLRRRLSGNGV
jgi:hypothetical protein